MQFLLCRRLNRRYHAWPDLEFILPVNIGNLNEFTIIKYAPTMLKVTGSKSELCFEPLPEDDPVQRRQENGWAGNLRFNWRKVWNALLTFSRASSAQLISTFLSLNLYLFQCEFRQNTGSKKLFICRREMANRPKGPYYLINCIA